MRDCMFTTACRPWVAVCVFAVCATVWGLATRVTAGPRLDRECTGGVNLEDRRPPPAEALDGNDVAPGWLGGEPGQWRDRLAAKRSLFVIDWAAFTAEPEPLTLARALEEICAQAGNISFSDRVVEVLNGLQHLDRLAIYQEGALSLQGLDGARSLKDLAIHGCALDDKDIEPLGAMESLRALELWGCRRLTGRGLLTLRRAEKLARLTISGSSLTTGGLRSLMALTQLQGLAVVSVRDGDYAAGDTVVSYLDGHTALTTLRLDGNAVTDAGCVVLGDLQSLTSLRLESGSIGNRGLAELGALRRLRVLSLRNARIDHRGLQHLTGLRELHTLDLSGATGIDDAGMGAVRHLRNLRVLRLSKAAVSDEGVASLRSLPQLEELHLEYTKVTAAALRELSRFPRLKAVALFGTGVSSSDVGRALPGNGAAVIDWPDLGVEVGTDRSWD